MSVTPLIGILRCMQASLQSVLCRCRWSSAGGRSIRGTPSSFHSFLRVRTRGTFQIGPRFLIEPLMKYVNHIGVLVQSMHIAHVDSPRLLSHSSSTMRTRASFVTRLRSDFIPYLRCSGKGEIQKLATQCASLRSAQWGHMLRILL